jgi:hypothetical protein
VATPPDEQRWATQFRSALGQGLQYARRRFLWTWLAVACLSLLTVGLWFAAHRTAEINDQQTRAIADTGHVKADEASDETDKIIRYLKGEQGIPGVPGANGQPGTAGQPGTQPQPGDQGPKGDTVPAVPPGTPGSTGPLGPVGSPGPVGGAGPPGTVGEKGASGEQGAAGEPGQAGPSGEQGPQGPEGPPGPQGPAGAAGAPGPVGPPGGCPAGTTRGPLTVLTPEGPVPVVACLPLQVTP